MQYLGGKARTAVSIAPHLMKWVVPGVTYWEPFLGGASVASLVAPVFSRAVLADVHEELIDLWRAVVGGWQPPATVSEIEYHALRNAEPSALRTFVGFGASFGGKWWGGFARPHVSQRDHAGASSRSLMKRAMLLRDAGVELCSGDYRATCHPLPGDVVYLDPPYAGTTGYKGTSAFNHADMWTVATDWARSGVHVYVSEFTAPVDWRPVWIARHRNELRRGSDRTDALFSWESCSVSEPVVPACIEPLVSHPVGMNTLYWWKCTPATRHTAERWERVPYPAPEVGARLAVDGEVPRGALSVRRTAQGAGWVVVATYARGWLPHARSGAPLRVVDSLALRMRHPDGRRAVAVWHDGRFELAYRILPALRKIEGVKELTAYLVHTG